MTMEDLKSNGMQVNPGKTKVIVRGGITTSGLSKVKLAHEWCAA